MANHVPTSRPSRSEITGSWASSRLRAAAGVLGTTSIALTIAVGIKRGQEAGCTFRARRRRRAPRAQTGSALRAGSAHVVGGRIAGRMVSTMRSARRSSSAPPLRRSR